MDIDLSTIGELLALGSGPNALFSILLYIIFFLAVIVLFTLPDKNLVATLLIAAVVICAVVAKLSLSARDAGIDPIFTRGEFGMLAINALMFTFPFIVAGVTRKNRLARGVKSTLPAILCGLFAGVYFFLFWVLVQRPLGLA
jgi:hypothetical protein